MICRALFVVLALAAGTVRAQMDAHARGCLADLDVLPGFLLENDAGARDHIARKGEAIFEAALARARIDAAKATTDEACVAVLRTYLRTYRRGHLNVSVPQPPPGSAGRPLPMPAFRALSPQTAQLVVPSFGDPAGAPLKELLERHAGDIAARPNLVVDIRGNNGGSDWTYAPLLALVDANVRRTAGTEFLATPANIDATERACDMFAPDSAPCREFMRKIAAAMRGVPGGRWVLELGDQPLMLTTPAKVAPRPQRVAVLMDERCASSCEEFIITVRQSWKVKLFGQSTAGVLDYSNMRPHPLPSGRHLLYATSRSLRLPAFPVDAAGIPPDQALPKPADDAGREAELREVVKVIESGG